MKKILVSFAAYDENPNADPNESCEPQKIAGILNVLRLLEAAIGIEPMNKGFAVLANMFAQDRLSVHTCIFIIFSPSKFACDCPNLLTLRLVVTQG